MRTSVRHGSVERHNMQRGSSVLGVAHTPSMSALERKVAGGEMGGGGGNSDVVGNSDIQSDAYSVHVPGHFFFVTGV